MQVLGFYAFQGLFCYHHPCYHVKNNIYRYCILAMYIALNQRVQRWQQTQNMCIAFVQRRTNVFEIGPVVVQILYKYFVFTGMPPRYIHLTLVQCWSSVGRKNICSQLWETGVVCVHPNFESQRSQVRLLLWHSSVKEKNVSSLPNRKNWILWGASMTES